jgi:CubicO group peptidase (beta-lactamase class C family)
VPIAESTLPDEKTLRDVISQVAKEVPVPAIGAIVSLGGTRVSAYLGRATHDSDHPLGSYSRFELSCFAKLLASFVTLDIAAKGVLDMFAPIHRYLPELEQTADGAISVHHLLSHTSGYRGLDITDARVKWAFSWDQFVTHFHTYPLSFPPGLVFNYEHSEHVVLGEIIRRTLGKTVREQLDKTIFDPLAIETGRAVNDKREGAVYVGQHRFSREQREFVPVASPPFSNFWAASLPDMTITLPQLVTIIEALMCSTNRCHFVGLPSNVLEALMCKVIQLPTQVTTGANVERRPYAFSRGCGHYRFGFLGHNGSMPGQTCAIRFKPEADLCVAVGLNAFAPYARDLALERIIGICTGEIPERRIESGQGAFDLESLTAGFTLQEVAGNYRGSYFGEITVIPEKGGLILQVGRKGPLQFIAYVRPAPHGRFFLRAPMALSLGFIRDPTSGAPALTMNMHAYKRTPSS